MVRETVVLASLSHETNTFVENPPVTTREACGETTGQEMIKSRAGTETQLGGIIEVADEEHVDLRPILSAGATPGPPLERDAYECYVSEITAGVTELREELDGVMLPLHGAMVPEHLHDGEGPLIERIRDIVGPEIPISVTLDLHGNVTRQMMEHADSLVGYKEYPHLDKAETGRLGMSILLDAIRGEATPTMHIERPPQIIFQPKAYTQSGPMREIMDQARAYQRREKVLAVSVFVGYYHADVPEMGVSTPVVTDDDPDLARELSRDLAETLWRRREEFVDTYPGPAEAVANAKALAADLDATDGPVVMGDFGSNPGGGGASDGTTIPRAFLDQEVDGAGYAFMYDPAVVKECVAAGVGEHLTVTLGGKTDDYHGEPIENLPVYVKAITDGRYTNMGTSHSGYGVQNDIGPTVHLECGESGDLDVIVTGTRHSAFDAESWRHIGIQPERLDVLCIPSFIAFLGDYEPISGAVVLADTPGVSAVDPVRFEYEHRPRPLYPLDELAADDYPDW